MPEAIEPEALDRAHGFALELIRRLDADVGRRAGTGPKPKRAPAAPGERRGERAVIETGT